MARESIRGTGRDAAGPLDITHRIHAHIKENPGIDREQIVKWAIENSHLPWFPLGHARRRYAKHLNTTNRLKRVSRATGGAWETRLGETPATIAARPSETGDHRAVRYLITVILWSAVKNGSLSGGPNGYTVARELGETQGLTKAQMLVGYDEHRELHLRAELIRVIRPDFDRIATSHYRLTLKQRELLKLWLDAAMVRAQQIAPPPVSEITDK